MTSKVATVPSNLQERLRFEELLADLSSRFVNLPPAEVDREIEDALQLVCEHVGIDFAVLWQWSAEETGVIRPTHFYPSQDGLQPAEPLRQEHYPWVEGEMLAGRLVVLSSMGELPEEATVDRGHELCPHTWATAHTPSAHASISTTLRSDSSRQVDPEGRAAFFRAFEVDRTAQIPRNEEPDAVGADAAAGPFRGERPLEDLQLDLARHDCRIVHRELHLVALDL